MYKYKHNNPTHQPANSLHQPTVPPVNSHDFLPGWTKQDVTKDMR